MGSHRGSGHKGGIQGGRCTGAEHRGPNTLPCPCFTPSPALVPPQSLAAPPPVSALRGAWAQQSRDGVRVGGEAHAVHHAVLLGHAAPQESAHSALQVIGNLAPGQAWATGSCMRHGGPQGCIVGKQTWGRAWSRHGAHLARALLGCGGTGGHAPREHGLAGLRRAVGVMCHVSCVM